MLSEEEKDILALFGVPGIGAKNHAKLLAWFGSPAAVFEASKSDLMEVDGIGEVLAGNILRHDRDTFVKDQIRLMQKCGAIMLTHSSPEYPKLLLAFKSAPPVLFVRGDISSITEKSVAFVGTRKPSEYGIRMARKLAGDIASAGYCIVSGMAAGIDAVSHHEAIQRGGKTVAVFGCGVDVIYPASNKGLSESIVKSGCLLSHFKMGESGMTGNFPARNAVIAGMSLGVVVVEAPMKSGALITAELALKASRKLFTVPGNADSPKSEGTNNLAGNGAIPVIKAEDILKALGDNSYIPISHIPSPSSNSTREQIKPVERPLPEGLTGDIMRVLREGSCQIEVLCSKLGKPVHEILTELTVLEMDGLIRQKPGKVFEIA
jgi:DNA processing protein